MISSDILIIGAGLAGLHFAHLVGADKKVIILEKSKGLGGRLATRRVDNIGIDHGVQWFNQTNEISEDVQSWLTKKWLQEDPRGHYSPQGMTSLSKHLAEGLTIYREQKVKVMTKSDGWIVETETGETFSAPIIVLTAPLPQAAELLKMNHLDSPQLESLVNDHPYNKALQGIFIFESLPDEMKSFEKDGHKFTLMREKNLHPLAGLFALSAQKSEDIFDQDDQSCLEIIQKELEKFLPKQLKINHQELKRWRYATAREALSDPFIEAQPDLYLIGDSFLYPDIRGSILSAKSLASHLDLI